MYTRVMNPRMVWLLAVPFLALGMPLHADEPRFIGVSRIDQLPPLPPGATSDFEAQPTGVPIPIFEVINDEATDRGGTRDTGLATAIVYRNSHDNGYANYNKAITGNFIGNLLHLGNRFPEDGGEIKSYDLLIYNSSSNPGGDATVRVSLWDGDPLGIIDTRISDPPQPIPGTTCTFSGLVKGGTGSNGCTIDSNQDGTPDKCDGGFLDGGPCEDDIDCGLCPAVSRDDIPECPGLFRLVCDFDEKVMLQSRNVWMIVEVLEGCRVGWRWAYLEGPEIAAVGEENFCAGTCPATPYPCVDLAIEMADAVSQWSFVGDGTCCEDPGIPCDHSDGTYECGHPTTCSDGVADDFDAFCFGAPTYFASFVASIYANTDTRFILVPVGASGEHTIIENEIIMPSGGQTINFEIFGAGWGSDEPLLQISTWQAKIDSSTYTTGLSGFLTNSRPSCTTDADCPDYATGEFCRGGYCGGAWQDCPARDGLCLALPACDVSGPDPRCGSTQVGNGPTDDGTLRYGASLRLESSANASGTFTIDFVPDPSTFMISWGIRIPLVAYIPAKVTFQPDGQCCDLTQDDFICIADSVTPDDCYAMGGDTFDPSRTCADPCPVSSYPDEDACTWDAYDPWRYLDLYPENFDVFTQCCDWTTGATCLRADENSCTDDYCEFPDSRGECLHVPIEDGSTCDDLFPCLTVDDQCIGGECIGTDIHTISCTAHEDCTALTGGLGSCDQGTGFCRCVPADCEPPTVMAEGPRYMALTPAGEYYRVALRVSGSPDDPDVSCVVGYAQTDGRVLEPQPGEQPEDLAVYMPPGPGGWGTAHVFGRGLVGSPSYDDVNTYLVQTDCDPDNPGTRLSDPVSVALWRYGDVGGVTGPDGTIDFLDISIIVDGFRNVWGTPVCCSMDSVCSEIYGPLSFCNTTWEGCQYPEVTPGRCQISCVNLDLKSGFGCVPDCGIDFVDIAATVDVFRNHLDPCTIVCP